MRIVEHSGDKSVPENPLPNGTSPWTDATTFTVIEGGTQGTFCWYIAQVSS